MQQEEKEIPRSYFGKVKYGIEIGLIKVPNCLIEPGTMRGSEIREWIENYLVGNIEMKTMMRNKVMEKAKWRFELIAKSKDPWVLGVSYGLIPKSLDGREVIYDRKITLQLLFDHICGDISAAGKFLEYCEKHRADQCKSIRTCYLGNDNTYLEEKIILHKMLKVRSESEISEAYFQDTWYYGPIPLTELWNNIAPTEPVAVNMTELGENILTRLHIMRLNSGG